MRRLVSSAFAATVAVFARRAVVVALILLTALCVVVEAQAETPLRRPLLFLPAASVLVVTPGAANVVERVMQVSPYLAPQPDTLTAHSARAFRRLAARQPDLARCSADTLARLFLVTGEAHIAAALDRERLTVFFRPIPPTVPPHKRCSTPSDGWRRAKAPTCM